MTHPDTPPIRAVHRGRKWGDIKEISITRPPAYPTPKVGVRFTFHGGDFIVLEIPDAHALALADALVDHTEMEPPQ